MRILERPPSLHNDDGTVRKIVLRGARDGKHGGVGVNGSDALVIGPVIDIQHLHGGVVIDRETHSVHARRRRV